MSTGTEFGTNRQETHTRRAPADAADFVANAERISNAANVREALAVYAPDAILESVTDGTLLVLRGTSELRDGIEVMFAVARTRSIQVRKQLVASTEETIVNTWEGTVGHRRKTHGIEIWSFDTDGMVRHQRLYTFLDVRPDSNWTQRLRILALYPRTALAFLRAQRRAG